jgi:hypothetical protein
MKIPKHRISQIIMKEYVRLFYKTSFRSILILLLTILIFQALSSVSTAQNEQIIHPNNFVLNGESFSVTYSTTSITGEPMLTYKDAQKRLNFSGTDIRVLSSEIGDQITVTIDTIPDLSSVTLTILIPTINLPETSPVQFWAKAIFTTHKTSIGGPNLIKKAIQSYRVDSIFGKASFVIF